MKKIYVIDTNILIHAPEAILNFEDNEVVLPMSVLEELDGLKNFEKEKGRNAREAIRYLEELRVKGNLVDGVETGYGGTIRVEKNYVAVTLPSDMPEDKMDNRILKVCLGLQTDYPEKQVILVTKDILLRIKSQMLAIEAQDYTTDRLVKDKEQYSGRMEVYVEEEHFKDLKKKGIKLEYIYQMGDDGIRHQVIPEMNQFMILKADQSTKKTQLGRFDGTKIVSLQYKKNKPYGVSPRNAGQYFLQEALMTPAENAPLVIVKGLAGTAKTFYALAVGLEKVFNLEKKEYRKILISRPNAQFDDDIGYLPGTEQEKIAPLMRPIIDNLEQLIDSNEEERYRNEEELHGKIDELFSRRLIETEAMNFIRGRSFVNIYLIIDEAQNMTPKQVKGIITRAGKGTKIILLGDPNQIDNPYLDEQTNGLSYASEYMKDSPFCYQITLTAEECERSELAMDAIKRL